MKTVVSIAGEAVDLICRREYGDESGFAEAVYAVNPGLAFHGPLLPAGVAILLPDVAVKTPADTPLRLWD